MQIYMINHIISHYVFTVLSLGHSIVYVTIRKDFMWRLYGCLKWLMLGDFFLRLLGSFESIYHSISYSLVSKMSCRSFYRSILEKLMRNDMAHPVFIHRIPKFTLLVSFSVSCRFALRIFCVFLRLFRGFYIRKL